MLQTTSVFVVYAIITFGQVCSKNVVCELYHKTVSCLVRLSIACDQFISMTEITCIHDKIIWSLHSESRQIIFKDMFWYAYLGHNALSLS